MSLPWKTRVFWTLFNTFEFAPAMQQPVDRVRKASDLRAKLLAMPASRMIVGTTNPDAFAVDTSMTLDDGTELPLRVYRPASSPSGPLPVIVNFHGGGWVSGDIAQSEWWASSVAAGAKAVVVSVGYRLAPEHPFPTPTEDCYAATCWVAKRATELGIDPARLAVMGDSAGGNIAAVVAMMARDRSGPDVALQVLLYPSVDLVGHYASADENANAPILSKKDVDNVPRLYFHGVKTEMTDPYASPLLGRLDGLPPVLIQTAQYDPLRDQGFAYAAALREAGGSVRHTNYVRAVHGYISLPKVVPAAEQALAEVVQVMNENFG